MTWKITDIKINEPTPSDVFSLTSPAGFVESKDGAVPSVRLSGGPDAKRKAILAAADRAKDILHNSPPPDDPRFGNWVRTAIPVGFVALALTCLVLRRKWSHGA